MPFEQSKTVHHLYGSSPESVLCKPIFQLHFPQRFEQACQEERLEILLWDAKTRNVGIWR